MKSILIIDNNRNFSRLLCRFLSDRNFQVFESINLEIPDREVYDDSLSLIKDRYPDLVICSLESLAFARTKCQTFQGIRDIFSGVKIPWIFLTTEPNIFDLSGKLRLLGVPVIRKPVSLNIILEIIQSELKRSKKYNNFDEVRLSLTHHYYFNELESSLDCDYLSRLESLLDRGLKSTYGKLRGSSKTSKTFAFLSRRCYLPIKKLENNLKIKSYHR